MTKYYITYTDWTGYKGGTPTDKVVEIEAKDMNGARLYVIKRFLKDWVQKKPYIYKPKVIPAFSIGTKKPNIKTRHYHDTGQIEFLRYPDKVIVVYEPSEQKANFGFYAVDIRTGKLIMESKVYW